MLPDYPRTLHLPWKANASSDDKVATERECKSIFTSPTVAVQEKVDGASCGMCLNGENALIRNRNHILSKGYNKQTPAKAQFARVWNWFYENIHLLQALNEQGPYSVYGEWLYAQHGLEYDLLPSLFVTYDVYDYEAEKYVCPVESIRILTECGFAVVPQLHLGPVASWEQLEELANQPSPFTTKGNREGVYLKVSDGRYVTDRFKMVRADFKQGALWSESVINRNKVAKA